MAEISDIWGLQYALDNKAHVDHEHSIRKIAGLKEALDSLSRGGGSSSGGGSGASTIAQVAGLQTALDGKAAAGHSHAIDAVTGLQVVLDGKAAAGHSHAIAQVAGLQAALDGKTTAGHTHAIDAVTGLQAALAGKAAAGHSHAIATSSADGFMTAADKTKLDSLSNSSGASTIAQVSGLQAALDGKAAIDHTHPGLTSSSASPVQLPYTVTQSSTYQTTPLGTYANLTDGAFNTGAGTGNDAIAWIKADLGSVKAISEIWLGGGNIPGWGSIAPYLNVATLEVSRDNTSWAIVILSLAQITDTTITKFAFGGLAARYVRVRRSSNYLGVGELRILG
jgi:Phage tail repeat like/F5/8 type C domain